MKYFISARTIDEPGFLVEHVEAGNFFEALLRTYSAAEAKFGAKRFRITCVTEQADPSDTLVNLRADARTAGGDARAALHRASQAGPVRITAEEAKQIAWDGRKHLERNPHERATNPRI